MAPLTGNIALERFTAGAFGVGGGALLWFGDPALRACGVAAQAAAARRLPPAAWRWPARTLLDVLHVSALGPCAEAPAITLAALCLGKWLGARGRRERVALGAYLAALAIGGACLPARAWFWAYCGAEWLRRRAPSPTPAPAESSGGGGAFEVQLGLKAC